MDDAAAEAAAEAAEAAAEAAGLVAERFGERSSVRVAPPPTHLTGVLRVLEVGAGNGELTHYLRRELHGRGVYASVVACDDGSWPLPWSSSGRVFGRVERLSCRDALRRYRPHLVLAAWMPMGIDWSTDFRACRSVGEYMLLGEAYDGAAGHNWATWGNPAFAPDSEGGGEGGGVAPYLRDGWSAVEAGDVSRWMLSRFASDTHDCERNSSAVAFRRGT